jgi:hypothetical protein
MNKKRKIELEKYWMQINKMHRDLKYMKFDHELKLDEVIQKTIANIEKIKVELERQLNG